MIIHNGYLTYKSNECLIGCLENYFRFFNIPIDGCDICFYNEGLNIRYKSGEFDSLRVPYNYYEVLIKLGIAYKKIQLDLDFENLKNYLIELVEKDTPIIIEIDSKNLFYDSTFSNYVSVFHTLNLIGYDYTEDMFCISDSYIPAFKSYAKQLWIPAEEFLKAWSNHTVLIILEELNNYSIKNLNTKNLLIKQLDEYVKGKKDSNICNGSIAVKQFFYELKNALVHEWNVDVVVNMNYQLHVFGFYMGREYIKLYLNKIGKENEANELEKIINNWKMNCLSLTKCVITQKKDRLEDKFNSIFELCEYENSFFLKILDSLI